MFISVEETKKGFLKNKKKSLFIVPCTKKSNVSKSILKDLSIENITDDSYEFFCKTNNINLIPTNKQNNVLIVGLGSESKITLQSILNAFSKIDFIALPKKDIFLICDNLTSDRNKLIEFLEALSLHIILNVYSFPKNKKITNVFNNSSKLKLTFLCNSNIFSLERR